MSNESSVSVIAPARLAFTLIDLSLGSDRINGGAGVAISNPSFGGYVSFSDESKIVIANGVEFAYKREVLRLTEAMREQLRCQPFQVTVTSGIPSHTGFGSKTATLLGVGRAIATLCGKDPSTQSLANLARRGGTSGIGVNVFDLGGFIVDGGHSVPVEHAEDREIFLPSRFSVMKTIPPVLFHSRFPWPLLIVVPQGRAIQGDVELAHFKKVCPFPREKVHEIAYIACFKMPAAILERNYLAFCEAVNALQRSYWKASQIQNQTDELRYVLTNGQNYGFDAIGISSNGPALYGLSQNPEQAERWLEELVREGIVRAFWRTTDSSGATVRRISHKDAIE